MTTSLLSSSLEKLKNLEQIYFVEPGGNWGDRLIYMGAQKLADSLNLQYQTLTFEEFITLNVPKHSGIYLHGSGGFNKWASGKPFDLLEKALSIQDAYVIQGPQSCEEDKQFLRSRMEKINELALNRDKGKFDFFTREKMSNGVFDEILDTSVISHKLNQDTAFYLIDKDIYQAANFNENRGYALCAVRIDDESKHPIVLPKLKKMVVLDPAFYAKSFEHWLRIHIGANSVFTNRTHSTIVSAILKKDVTMYGGKYHKNKSIWDFNLKDLGVRWITPEETMPTQKSLFHRITKSYKYNELLRWAKGVPLS